jgi:hypothetical protein
MQTPSKEIQQIQSEVDYVKQIATKLIQILPCFNIADRKILPYGLKPHTRSVAWLVEQVVVQQTKFHKDEFHIDEVNFDLPDTCLHDFEIVTGGKSYYVNVKAHQVGNLRKNKNDIAAVEKLFLQYTAKPDYNLIYLCIGIEFDDVTIRFNSAETIVFSAQFLPIYVNPRNDKIQAYYSHTEILRTRIEFLKLLIENSKSIKL